MKGPRFPKSRKRIVINALHAKRGGGVTYLRNILRHFATDPDIEFHLFLHEEQMPLFDPLPEGIHLHLFDFRSTLLNLLLWEQCALPVLTRVMEADVVFSPANYGPVFARRPVVLLRNAVSVLGGEKRFGKIIYWLGLSVMTFLSLLSCRRAIAVSNYARRQLTFGQEWLVGRRTAVVYHGVGPLFRRARNVDSAHPFMLAVSDIYVQKNLHTLISALPEIFCRFPEIRLLIAGRPIDRDYFSRIQAQARTLGVSERIEFLGHCPIDRLLELYAACSVFVFPSTVETFGNPLVEAMACGAPIACSNTAAMPEIVGENAVFFDPKNPADIASGVSLLIADPELANKFSEKGAERAQNFSWEVAGQRTCAVLKAAAG